MEINGLILQNEEKVDRAINGAVGREGKAEGGVGADASPEQIIAAYDKLGGLILKGGHKVKTGCFWNFKEGKPVENPKVMFTLRDINGNEVSIPDGVELPVEVKAVEIIAKKKRGRKTRVDVDEN